MRKELCDVHYNNTAYRFCHPKIVSACVCLLERYDKNRSHTNHCIVKMLHRIAFDCNRPAMMFQATLFLTFQKILHNPMPHLKVGLKNMLFFIELRFFSSLYEICHVFFIYVISSLSLVPLCMSFCNQTIIPWIINVVFFKLKLESLKLLTLNNCYTKLQVKYYFS